ncbi:sulfatase family protein [Pontiella sulfatireligans]|uniref:Arylsulfatase n=1 Tax=Pontiella sulfatireligans TaxID=2750658 RepID=A0A6C2UFA4_9BACT|nr:sulfatase [Pontiella sulfatireligans]SPS74133.1 sulfatase S1_8 [Kiritimatiellales bacterium]VGO18101.1 Arylsulfatase [Pontiella sulfatireligans]
MKLNNKKQNTKPLLLTCILALCCNSALAGARQPAQRPNILWITIEDWCLDLSCYGTKGIDTPHLDKLASEGIRYEQAFSTGPVCSVSRSAMMTGFYQNYIGAGQHRLLKQEKKPLPYGIKPIPQLMQEAGYFTALMSWKTDVNFLPCTREELFMGEDWTERAPGQPFFARITIGGTHRSWIRDPARPIDIKDVELPPYYPDTPFCRRDWANGLEQMQLVDREVGALLQRLEDEGLADNTLVIFISDHGRCHVRGKQFLYDGGLRIPMIVRWPGKVKPGQVNGDMVMAIDLCATVLEAGGVKAPIPLHGKSLFGEDVKNRKYVFAARDKMDETHDSMRAIRSKDWKLIHNLMPERPYCQYNRYKEGGYPMLAEMNVMNMKGQLTPEQAAFMAPSKPVYELFDLRNDPFEVKNLADDPKYAEVKAELLEELNNWRENVILDQGVSDQFRALNVYPATCPTPTVDAWVAENGQHYDFNKTGWPNWYPTRTLAEWEKALEIWTPYVFREAGVNVQTPQFKIIHSKKKPKKSTKFEKSKKYFDAGK